MSFPTNPAALSFDQLAAAFSVARERFFGAATQRSAAMWLNRMAKVMNEVERRGAVLQMSHDDKLAVDYARNFEPVS